MIVFGTFRESATSLRYWRLLRGSCRLETSYRRSCRLETSRRKLPIFLRNLTCEAFEEGELDNYKSTILVISINT